jgi:hypothetical protein
VPNTDDSAAPVRVASGAHGRLTKQDARTAFNIWLDLLSEDDLILYSDGSQLPPAARGEPPCKGYGFAIYRKSQSLCTGYGWLYDTSVVLSLNENNGLQQIKICLDNTAAIWCLRGNPFHSGQQAFLDFHRLADETDQSQMVTRSRGYRRQREGW